MNKKSYQLRQFFITVLLFLLGVTMVVSLAFSSFTSPRAQAVAAVNPPYGGMILATYYCTCSGNWWTLVGPPSGPLELVYNNTVQYENYMLPMMGVWSVGLYNRFGSCWYYVGLSCSELQSDGSYTTTVGTSF